MSNKVIQAGVEAFNAQEAEAMAARVVGVIRNLRAEDATIAGARQNIEQFQKELKSVEDDVVTDELVLGRKLDVTSSPNAATMADAIKKLNDMKQEAVRTTTVRLTNAIVGQQNVIKACEARKAKMREEMATLVAPTTTVSEVLGNK